jgi:hypothetical protein
MIRYELVADDCDYDKHMNTALYAMLTTAIPINNMKPYTWRYEPFI